MSSEEFLMNGDEYTSAWCCYHFCDAELTEGGSVVIWAPAPQRLNVTYTKVLSKGNENMMWGNVFWAVCDYQLSIT